MNSTTIYKSLNNLQRLGLYIILDALEEVKYWTPRGFGLTERQLKYLKQGNNPLSELQDFFFNPDGAEEIIKMFKLPLNITDIQSQANELLAQAELNIKNQ